MVEALTHKSFLKNTVIQNANLNDYERLEFLGDTVLNFLLARFFFVTNKNSTVKQRPNWLHKMTSLAQTNALLNLIVIESGIHNYIQFSPENEAHRRLIEISRQSVLSKVRKISTNELGKKTKFEQVMLAIDFYDIYSQNNKIFADVFESLIAAVYLDCGDMERTWKVLSSLIMPYIEVYVD